MEEVLPVEMDSNTQQQQKVISADVLSFARR